MFFPQSFASAMAVGVQSPRSNATPSEPDQQDDASLVLTVFDGSEHVKSEPCSENEGFVPERDDEDFFGNGENATGDTPPFEEPSDGFLPGSSQCRADELFTLFQQPGKGLSVGKAKRWAILDEGRHLWAKDRNPVHVVHGVGPVAKGTKGVGLPLGQRSFGFSGKGKSLGKTLQVVGTPRRDFDQWKGAPLWFPGVGPVHFGTKGNGEFSPRSIKKGKGKTLSKSGKGKSKPAWSGPLFWNHMQSNTGASLVPSRIPDFPWETESSRNKKRRVVCTERKRSFQSS